MLTSPSSSVGVPRQSKNNMETTNIALGAELEFLNLKEVAAVLRIAPISVYRIIARRALPVYRTCRKILFKKKDVLDYLERSRSGSPEDYGHPKG